MRTPITNRGWQQLAKKYAEIAHDEHFPERWGTFVDEDCGFVVIFNNHPYAQYPDLRSQQLAQFREYLRAHGIKELGYATYPQDGYTYALIVETTVNQGVSLEKEMERILVSSVSKLARTADKP